MSRDLLYQAIVFDNLKKEAARRTGQDVTPFVTLVASRIERGALEYGDGAYLRAERDNPKELIEEAADAVAYALFEMMRLNTEQSPPASIHHQLFEIMLLATQMYQLAQRVRWELRER